MSAPSFTRAYLDAYSVRARLQPAMITVLPLGLTLIAWFPQNLIEWGLVASILMSAGGTFLLAEISRDSKKKEPSLFSKWGGQPTTRALRHREASNRILLEQRHKNLQKLNPDIKLPSPQQELADPTGSDEIYAACVAVLRETTRSRERFPLVFEELCNYGFRRNLWGMRVLAVGIALASVSSLFPLILLKKLPLNFFALTIGLIDLGFLIAWTFRFNSSWVRLAGEAYADSLLSSCGELLLHADALPINNREGKVVASKPIKLLFLGVNPPSNIRLRLDHEVSAIDGALGKAQVRDRFELAQGWAVTATDLQEHLLRHDPDIVHLSTHGTLGGRLILENDLALRNFSTPGSPSTPPTPTEEGTIRAFGKLFGAARGRIRCVVLNACHSEAQAHAIAEHIECVIGMASSISDDSALRFSQAFYGAIAYGKDIQTAFNLGCAQIGIEKPAEENLPQLITPRCDPTKLVLLAR